MKKQFLSVLAFSAILLSSCGGTAKIEKASACGQEGEITASSATAIAETESGKVAGYVENGIYIYKGIPYAKAERFMPPQPADKWEGVRSSRMFGPTCPQAVRMGWGADEHAFAFHWDDGYPGEDCLRVNIWTPGLNDGKKRPVMVWLHGGGYAAGSGQELPSYDGFNLAKKGDAVVVTLNHRLNVLGFLDLSAYGDKYAKSGNAGLLDLVAALQWVNKNIAAFGGDAQNVTIFGQSGGGGKVSTLLATPSAKGLYHKAIVQSGSMLRTMDAKYSRRIGAAVMDELGLKASQIDELQKMPYERLLAAGEKAVAKVKAEVEKEDGISTFIFGWAPTVDGDVLPAQPFDPQAPAQSKDVPVMIHRVVFGSIERFIGIITEHFAGAFPAWLAPVQVKILPVTDRALDYAKDLSDALDGQGFRVEVDDRNEKIGKKIREATLEKVPYMIVVGDRDMENKTVSVRTRAGEDLGAMSLEDFTAKLKEVVDSKVIQ